MMTTKYCDRQFDFSDNKKNDLERKVSKTVLDDAKDGIAAFIAER